MLYKNLLVMKKNMGNLDRIIRVLIAAVIAVLYFTGVVTGAIGIMLLATGGIFLITSIDGSCPIYALFGLKSCKKEEHLHSL